MSAGILYRANIGEGDDKQKRRRRYCRRPKRSLSVSEVTRHHGKLYLQPIDDMLEGGGVRNTCIDINLVWLGSGNNMLRQMQRK